jgi:hypothetical protein
MRSSQRLRPPIRSLENVSWKIVEWRRYDSLRDFAQRARAFKRRRSIGKEPGRFYYSHALSKRWITGTTASDQGVPISAPPSHFSRKAREI